MSFEFNIVQNIYDLARLIQLKEDHYKRIDDVKTRRRSSADTTAKFESRAIVIKTMNIITISTFVNEKTSESTTWNSNQFRISISRFSNSIRIFNLDSIREQLMKKNKCFNCDESDHLNRDCSKLKKFRIAEMNVKKIENSKKNSLRQSRDEDKRVDYIVFFYERWFVWRELNTDRLFSEKILINNNDRHWCYWIRFRRWVSCAKNMWRHEHWINKISEETRDKSIWR